MQTSILSPRDAHDGSVHDRWSTLAYYGATLASRRNSYAGASALGTQNTRESA